MAEGANGISGDLILKVNIKPHNYFRREEYDIFSDAFVSIS